METMNMKANELMIGDWVYNKNIHEPWQVYPMMISQMRPDATTEDYNIFPIPLTAEILEKNGFINEGYAILKLDENSWLEYYYHEHRLRKYWVAIDEWLNHSEVKDLVFQCYCYYVHELQHALKLCGINKEIKL